MERQAPRPGLLANNGRASGILVLHVHRLTPTHGRREMDRKGEMPFGPELTGPVGSCSTAHVLDLASTWSTNKEGRVSCGVTTRNKEQVLSFLLASLVAEGQPLTAITRVPLRLAGIAA